MCYSMIRRGGALLIHVHKQPGLRALQHGSMRPDLCICLIESLDRERLSELQVFEATVLGQTLSCFLRPVNPFIFE